MSERFIVLTTRARRRLRRRARHGDASAGASLAAAESALVFALLGRRMARVGRQWHALAAELRGRDTDA